MAVEVQRTLSAVLTQVVADEQERQRAAKRALGEHLERAMERYSRAYKRSVISAARKSRRRAMSGFEHFVQCDECLKNATSRGESMGA